MLLELRFSSRIHYGYPAVTPLTNQNFRLDMFCGGDITSYTQPPSKSLECILCFCNALHWDGFQITDNDNTGI